MKQETRETKGLAERANDIAKFIVLLGAMVGASSLAGTCTREVFPETVKGLRYDLRRINLPEIQNYSAYKGFNWSLYPRDVIVDGK